jgi:hypothetical protein
VRTTGECKRVYSDDPGYLFLLLYRFDTFFAAKKTALRLEDWAELQLIELTVTIISELLP